MKIEYRQAVIEDAELLVHMEKYTGKVVAVYHRLNDNEDKWIVSLNGETIPEEEILETICFQEQYFMGELYTL